MVHSYVRLRGSGAGNRTLGYRRQLVFVASVLFLYQKQTSLALAHEQATPTERPPLVGEVSAYFCAVVSATYPHGRILAYRS
jgi:hypothetical protein